MSDSDDETLTSFCDMLVNLTIDKGDTSESDTTMNTIQSDTNTSMYETLVKTGRDSGDNSVITPKIKTKRRYLMSPMLRRGYYGRKRARWGYIHFVSSALKYTASLFKHLPGKSPSIHC